jgi:acetyl-CoA carboxylase biotin carboxyl carrier protein
MPLSRIVLIAAFFANDCPDNKILTPNPVEECVDIKDIKAIIDLMKKNSISEFELERQDFKIKLKRGINGGMTAVQDDGSGGMPAIAQTATAQAASLAPLPNINPSEIEIKSPMIGTFYRTPSPDSAAYVEVGNEVNTETIVCIIEAMKVMNEIKAEVRGIITQVMVEGGKPVEYGQPLFKVRPL